MSKAGWLMALCLPIAVLRQHLQAGVLHTGGIALHGLV